MPRETRAAAKQAVAKRLSADREALMKAIARARENGIKPPVINRMMFGGLRATDADSEGVSSVFGEHGPAALAGLVVSGIGILTAALVNSSGNEGQSEKSTDSVRGSDPSSSVAQPGSPKTTYIPGSTTKVVEG